MGSVNPSNDGMQAIADSAGFNTHSRVANDSANGLVDGVTNGALKSVDVPVKRAGVGVAPGSFMGLMLSAREKSSGEALADNVVSICKDMSSALQAGTLKNKPAVYVSVVSFHKCSMPLVTQMCTSMAFQHLAAITWLLLSVFSSHTVAQVSDPNPGHLLLLARSLPVKFFLTRLF